MNSHDASPRRAPSKGSWLVLAPILGLAINLRPVAVSIGPVLTDISNDLAMSAAAAGLLTSLPTLAFSIFGAATPAISRRFGMHVTVGMAVVALVAGQVGRALSHTSPGFLAWSLVALAGMATCNILVPGLVRLHFPNRVGLATALYSLTMTLGITAASIGTVPLANALGGWRAAYLAAAVVAVAALICWVPMLPRNSGRHARGTPRGFKISQVARTRMGWLLATLFGLQSAQSYSIFGWLPTIYMDAGMTQVHAGIMLGVATGFGVVPSFVVPRYAARVREPMGMFLVIMAFLIAGFTGLLVAPMTLPWLWAMCLAFGTASFPLILALLGLRARTAQGTTVLSGFVQSVGYLLGAAGPIAVGVLRDATGGWTVSILVLLAITIPMTITGLICCRVWFIEDEIAGNVPS